jgi:hypothetical protein
VRSRYSVERADGVAGPEIVSFGLLASGLCKSNQHRCRPCEVTDWLAILRLWQCLRRFSQLNGGMYNSFSILNQRQLTMAGFCVDHSDSDDNVMLAGAPK